MSPHLFLLVYLLLTGCIPQGGGPAPRAVLVVSSETYPLEAVLGALDSLGGLVGPRIDKTQETVDVGDSTISRFSHFEVAYWYPRDGSPYFGVGLVKWISALKGEGADEMRNRYFIDVYSEDKRCELCAAVETALKRNGISYFSACENPTTSSDYEKIRCGT